MKNLDLEAVSSEDLKTVKKPKKQREPMDIRSVFNRFLNTIDIEALKQPWMAKKAFRLISDREELRAWVTSVLSDESRWRECPRTGERMPVIAVDTETTGLDNRVIFDGKRYIVKNEIAGICLSSDGFDGIYIPITHEDGNNMSKEDCRQILQYLFDRSLLVFFNAKYDREVFRYTMGINFRPYPYFEDVQILKYLIDPKADLGDKDHYGDSTGLKFLSESELGLKQIELDQLTKVKAEHIDEETGKRSLRMRHVPFNWVPSGIALWYAAADAICTWLLWDKFHEEARNIKAAHKIDHELVDSISWMERQRFIIDVDRLYKMISWHQGKLEKLRKELNELTGLEEEFNPSSTQQLAKILFEIKGFDPFKFSEKTNLPSTDAETLEELKKLHPDDPFLKKLLEYREYVALHPENLTYEPIDHTARIHLRQCVVAGGRLSATGGSYEKDGGFGLNIQAIKRVEGNKWVYGRKLSGEPDMSVSYELEDLHPSCYKKEEVKKKGKIKNPKYHPDNEYGDPEFLEIDLDEVETKIQIAKGILNNHVGNYFGEWYCLVPKCDKCNLQHGPDTLPVKVDSEEILNLRALFVAPPGWTFFTTDYSNIEMRVAANISKEEAFIKEFLEGSGDFHSLTARAVFPEFSDPKISKARRKALRFLAKILNFALLYGGTAYTIFESMKKEDKNITFEDCKEMVDRYWAGVPGFAEWVNKQQELAKSKMICKTATGRIVKFKSAMHAQRIHEPTEEDVKNYRRYWELKNMAKELEDSGRKSKAYALKEKIEEMYRDKSTGIRNMQDYKRFIGKIQRVAINIPLQGMAGDMMRISLNRIREWAQGDKGVEQVIMIHGSVHDEIDYSIKNEYIPFIIPRITRLMKLCDLHEKQNWTVPIECDTEYGRSWDISEHLTGDSDHEPAGWTEISGLENYLPGGVTNFDKVLNQVIEDTKNKSEDPRSLRYLRKVLNPRCEIAIDTLKKYMKENSSSEVLKKRLIVCYQLDEYWNIDQEPDDSMLESLEDYERRVGLTVDNRIELPPCGRLEAMPLDSGYVEGSIEDVSEELEDEDPFGPQPVRITQIQSQVSENKVEEIKIDKKPSFIDGIPVLKSMSKDELKEFLAVLGIGNNRVKFILDSQIMTMSNVFVKEIPTKYIREE